MPRTLPLGLHLAATARTVERAFDDALAAVGGSRPAWLILLAVKSGSFASQREMATGVGVQGPTLTHHLNAMERDGLLVRTRDAANRRVHVVALTPAGEKAFTRLRGAATAFDSQLRAGLTGDQTDQLRDALDQLAANVTQAARA